ncbi:MAG: hypothetical protein H7Z40_18450 [Phycisphaerae bacterium]|nr:hypothetical protein [Gemmatimonadaceae bacterium]
MRTSRGNVLISLSMWALCGLGVAGCADVVSSASEPASIEFRAFAAPAVVIGDSLRDVSGVAIPVFAIVRNQQGDVLENAVVRYTYADAGRDTALVVDSLRGFVFARQPLRATGTTARIAARVGSSLQVLRTVLVTIRPDSVDRVGVPAIDTLRVSAPDTGAVQATNTSLPLTVIVRHLDSTASTPVPSWLVTYELLYPANPTNDSTNVAFLVNQQQKLSNIDTTDFSGNAERFVRIRAGQFPTGAAADSAVVRVTVSYQGKPLKGSPIRIVLPVKKKQ